jgi:aerobic carbon-monoxide dehydrogenase large subunit
MVGTGLGKGVKRKEDLRYLTGSGRYTDDVTFPNQAHARIVRSPHAHARINGIDTAVAKAMPGVLAVFTGADIAAAGLGGLPCGWGVTDRHGQPMAEPPHPLLVQDRGPPRRRQTWRCSSPRPGSRRATPPKPSG